jgi:hypothetical protein
MPQVEHRQVGLTVPSLQKMRPLGAQALETPPLLAQHPGHAAQTLPIESTVASTNAASRLIVPFHVADDTASLAQRGRIATAAQRVAASMRHHCRLLSHFVDTNSHRRRTMEAPTRRACDAWHTRRPSRLRPKQHRVLHAMPPIVLFPFRYRDRRTGRWIRARYKAAREEIAARYAEWEIVGSVETRESGGGSFRPFPVVTHAELMRLLEPQPDMTPALDASERFLARTFLRRYVTWCARTRRHDRIAGARDLYASLRPDKTLRAT